MAKVSGELCDDLLEDGQLGCSDRISRHILAFEESSGFRIPGLVP